MFRLVPPSDGLDATEQELITTLFDRTVTGLYQRLPTHRMKAILALHFEVGYDQETLANIFGVSQEQIALEVRNIRNILSGVEYKARAKKISINPSDILLSAWHMLQP